MVLQIYEVVSITSYLAVLLWALWSRDPLNLGAVIGGFLLCGFDWLWCSKGFWNATTASTLVMFPGLHIQGLQYPIAIACNWGVGYGFLPLVLSRLHPAIGRRLGVFHFPVMFAAFAILDIAIESLLISGIGAYAYHQAPRYLYLGVVWSNTWMLGGLLTGAYFGLAYARRWTSLPDGSGISLASETTWKGVCIGGGTILTTAFLVGTAQLFWWSAVTPWIDSGRPF
jgi:hypothetical protein